MPDEKNCYWQHWKQRVKENESMKYTVEAMGYSNALRTGKRYLIDGAKLQMWFRILRYKKCLREGKPEPTFCGPPVKEWDEWLSHKQDWLQVKTVAKSKGRRSIKRKIYGRWYMYLLKRRKKHKDEKKAYRQRNLCIIQPAFYDWSEITRNAMADRMHLHLRCSIWHQAAIRLKTYRNTVGRYQAYLEHARTLWALENWQVYMQRRRVHNLAGLDKLCAQPVKALFAIYCLTDNDDMRVYLECFKRWSSMARRRVLYEKFLAQHVGVMHHTLLKHSFDKIKDAARQYKECNTYIPKRTKIYAFSKTAILGDFAQLLGQAPVAFEDETQRAIETKHSRRTSRATIRAWQKTRRPDGRSGAGASDNLLWKKLILLLTVAMSHHRSKQLGWTAPIGGKTVHDYGRQRHWLQSKGAIQSKDLAFRSTQAEVKQKETEVREHFACIHLRCLKVLQMWRVDQAAKKVAEALPSMPTVLPPPGPKKAKKGKKGKTKGGDQKVASGSPAVTPAQTPGVVVRDRPPPYPYMMSESEDEDFSDHDEKREYDRTVEVKAWRHYLGGKDYDPEMYRFPEQGGVEKESEGLHYGSCSLLEFRSRPGRVPPFQPNLKTTVMKRKTRKLPPPASGIPVEPSNMAGRPLSMNPDGLVNLVTPGSDVEVSSNKKRPSPHRKIFDGEKDSSVKIWSGVGSGRFDEDGRHRQDDASRAGYLEDISPHKFDSLSAEERVAWEMSEIEKMEHQ